MSHSVPDRAATDAMRRTVVHVLCAVYDGARYLDTFLESLRAQEHRDWVLHVRDDGSTDGSAELVRRAAAADPRITFAGTSTERLGALGTFRWLWDRVPADAEYVMFADQDDVWAPDKIGHTLGVMRAAEADRPGPVLVHTDLAVVDDALRPLADSFWHYAGLTPEPTSLQRMAARNVVTGNTALVNRALRERVGAIPPEAAMHDWWVACVAAAFGRVIASPYASVRYRQHDANVKGARPAPGRLTTGASWRRAAGALGRTAAVRADLAAGARQAGAFAARHQSELPAADLRFLREYAALPGRGFARRKLDLCRLQWRAEFGLLRNVGLVIRG